MNVRPWLLLAVLNLACGTTSYKTVPHDETFQRAPVGVAFERPPARFHSDWWDAVNQGFSRPLGEAISPLHHIRRYTGYLRPLDVNAFGQVLDSSWFENRIGRFPVSPTALARGPDRLSGPAPGPLTVLSAKLEGATPGLRIRDTDGNIFFAKFDPPAFPEMSSSAEFISTKILWAAGYNVPENYVVAFDVERLVLAPDALQPGHYDAPVPMAQEDLRRITSLANPYSDGKVRALFSLQLAGKVVGPFDYRGVATDDPNDRVPHERRRSLRGLKVFMAWLNNVETQADNTLDMWIADATNPSVGRLKHYLLDFGDALGASGFRPKVIGEGYHYTLDFADIGLSLLSLGIYYPDWVAVLRSPYRSVGMFEAHHFRVDDWAARLPNPAFDQADELDLYWAASIVAQFRPAHLAAIVEAAGYSERGAAAWVIRVLTQRQFRILEHAFEHVMPLETPRTQDDILRLTDLAGEVMMLDPEALVYQWQIERADTTLAAGTSEEPRVDLSTVTQKLRNDPDFWLDPFLTVHIGRPFSDGEIGTVAVHLRVLENGLLPVGITRDAR